MQIRTRLTLQYVLIGGLIMLFLSLVIYYSSARFTREDFYSRLRSQSRSTAKFILNPYEPDEKLARIIEADNPANLQNKRIVTLNSLNDTLYNSDSNGQLKINRDILNKIRTEGRVIYTQEQYQVLGTLFEVNGTPFVVIAAAIDAEGNKRLRELRMILLAVFVTSIFILSAAGWFFSGKALKPMSDVVGRVEEISISSLNLRIPEGNGTDEIGRLARTFNNMLERLEASFSMQKNFIANASHELRTPLTSINGQLEVLMLKERSPEEYRTAVVSVMEDIKNLIDLANRLLLIARTSAEGPSGFSRSVRLDETVWQAREDLKKFNPGYNINISLDSSLTDSEQMVVKGDESLLRVAVTNLMENACKYSGDHTVDVKFGNKGKWIEIMFEDNGIGIPAEEAEKVFEPFFRGSNTMSVRGSGIGLSLVHKIIANHNGTVKLSSEPGRGSVFTITLPAQN